MPVVTCLTTKQIVARYSAPVTDCVRRLRAFPPPARGSQHTLTEEWQCYPRPDEAIEEIDEFGNRILILRHKRIAGELRLTLTLRSGREDAEARREENVPGTGLGAFLLPSALCDRAPSIEVLAGELDSATRTKPGNVNTQIELAEAINLCSHRALHYMPGSTSTTTTASAALTRGGGVCQDYAHLAIALCRACSLPARYVSGYNPAEGGMHAWVEVLCGEHWIGFDPTHGRRTRPDCVFVAVGRDYRDVAPMRATYRGAARVRASTRCRTVVENGELATLGGGVFRKG